MSKEYGIWLNSIVYKFSQEGNTDGTTEEEEKLKITVQSCTESIDAGGGYLVLRTKTGWSINDSEEFTKLLNIVEKGVKSKIK